LIDTFAGIWTADVRMVGFTLTVSSDPDATCDISIPTNAARQTLSQRFRDISPSLLGPTGATMRLDFVSEGCGLHPKAFLNP